MSKNVLEIIDLFDNYRKVGDYGPVASDALLVELLKRSPRPAYAKYSIKDNRTAAENAEIAEMQAFLDEEFNGEKLTRPELLKLLRTYPPVILEQLLICVMVMYLLREHDADFDTDSDAFMDFFDGWHAVVIAHNC